MTTLLAAPALRFEAGPKAGRRYEIGAALRIGRHPYNEVSLPDAAVSRYHCWITSNEDGIFLEDLGSSNGTFVNGIRVRPKRALRPGDRVRIGKTEFLLVEEE